MSKRELAALSKGAFDFNPALTLAKRDKDEDGLQVPPPRKKRELAALSKGAFDFNPALKLAKGKDTDDQQGPRKRVAVEKFRDERSVAVDETRKVKKGQQQARRAEDAKAEAAVKVSMRVGDVFLSPTGVWTIQSVASGVVTYRDYADVLHRDRTKGCSSAAKMLSEGALERIDDSLRPIPIRVSAKKILHYPERLYWDDKKEKRARQEARAYVQTSWKYWPADADSAEASVALPAEFLPSTLRHAEFVSELRAFAASEVRSKTWGKASEMYHGLYVSAEPSKPLGLLLKQYAAACRDNKDSFAVSLEHVFHVLDTRPPPCLGGDGLVLLADGTHKAVRSVAVGDRVATYSQPWRAGLPLSLLGSATVTATWRSEVGRDRDMVRLRGVFVTPDHPVCLQGSFPGWVRPDSAHDAEAVFIDAVFSLLLDEPAGVLLCAPAGAAGGDGAEAAGAREYVTACTLGQALPGPCHDAVWGTSEIADLMRSHPRFPHVVTCC